MINRDDKQVWSLSARCRGLLLDRDGVINEDHGFVSQKKDFVFMSGLFSFLRLAQDKGYRLAILTNQSGVARGMYSAQDFEKLNMWMLSEFNKQGIVIDLILGCFEHPEGTVAEYKRESFWRKPNPGMVLDAVQRLRLDPKRSLILGDQLRDMQAAQAAGIGTCLLLNEKLDAPMSGITRVKNFDTALTFL